MFWNILRHILFILPAEAAHHIASYALRFLGAFYAASITVKKTKPHIQRSKFILAGMPLDSPLGIAAGFDKDAKLVMGLRALGFGFIEVGTVTPQPQPGNPKPRLYRLPKEHALINRMGFNSQGAEVVAKRLKNLRQIFYIDFPIGVNLGKNKDTPLENAASDYVMAMRALYDVADYLVVNLSSPNTPGLTDLQDEAYLRPLLQTIWAESAALDKRSAGNKRPLFLKISSDLALRNCLKTVDIAMETGFSGIIAFNTSKRRDFPGLRSDDPRLQMEGGLSGAPLREYAVSCLGAIRSKIGPKAVLISVGGLNGAEDAKERLAAGANLLQVYTEFVYAGPGFPKRIARAFD